MPSGIVVLINDFDYFCAHRLSIFSHISNQGHIVEVYCGGVVSREKVAEISFHHIDIDRHRAFTIGDFKSIFRLAKRMADGDIDHLHSITIKANLLGALSRRFAQIISQKKIRQVLLSPGLGRAFSNADRSLWTSLRLRIVKLAFRILLDSKSDTVIFENSHDAQVWVDAGMIGEANAKVFPGTGVNTDYFKRAKTKDATEPFVVLFASRLIKAKGLEVVEQVARRCSEESQGIKFLIAGSDERDEPDRYDISRVVGLENVDYLGLQQDLRPYFEMADVVILPTLYGEGLPRVLLEGASFECALIASDIAGCRRIVKHEETGFLLPVLNNQIKTDDLYYSILKLRNEREMCKQMGQRARTVLQAEGFDQSSVNKLFLDLFS